jgi:hypothetical protein
MFFCSFKQKMMMDDFLKQLGITKANADERISGSILGGSINIYGIKNLKNIATGNRKAVTTSLLNYTKAYLNSPEFKKQYGAMKDKYKPTEAVAQTPAEFREEYISRVKKSVAEMEASVKKADANTKPIFEKVLLDGQKNLKEAEDPNNKMFVRYASNYDQLVKDNKRNYEYQLAQWEKNYPSNHLLYVEKRLTEFLDATKDVDFNAELVEKNGKKYFANPVYERKSDRWKMAFRAGREVVEPAREFAQKWIEEIN